MSVFTTLNDINVNDKTEQKNGLTYLSWAWAWGEVKKNFPEATYTIYETTNPQGYVCNYFTDGKTCWVKTGVTIEGIEHIEELPVMDYRNKSIPLDNITSFDVNKAIQRSLTKAVARHGLGLYIYAGEDLPEADKPVEKNVEKPKEEEDDTLQKPIEKKYIATIKSLITKYSKMRNGKEEELLKYYLTTLKVKQLEDLTNEQGIKLMQELNVRVARGGKQ